MSWDDALERTRTRPFEPRSPEAETKVTIACRCGAVATVSWKRRTALRCFGCDRAFEPPPHVVSPPLVWRPHEATPLGPVETARARRRGIAVAVLAFLPLALLLGLGIWLAFQAASAGPSAGP